MLFIVYQITNLVNGKIYIGVHQTEDPNDGYMGSGTVLRKAVQKYGEKSFHKKILHIYDNPTDMYSKERELVTESFIASKNTYNATSGGHGSWSHTKDHVTVKDNNGNTFNVHKTDPRYLSGELVFISTGRKHSETTRMKISEIQKKNPPWLNRKHSAETIEKMKKAARRKYPCPYCNKEMNAGNLKRHITRSH